MATYVNENGKLVTEYDGADREAAVTDYYYGMEALIEMLIVYRECGASDRIMGNAFALLQSMLPKEEVMQKAFK
jgi:hypothetical protein